MLFIYLGCNGFPYGMAQVERQKLIAKSLVTIGHQVHVINIRGVHSLDCEEIHKNGVFEGIHYTYTSGTPYRPQSFLKRNFYKTIGHLGEILYLIKLRNRGRIDVALVSSMLFSTVFYYWILSKLFGFKLVLDYVELNSALTKKGDKSYWDFIMFEKYVTKYVTHILSISNYLTQFLIAQNPSLRILKVPAICDVDKISSLNPPKSENPYFLFCGSVFYLEVIEFVLASYTICDNKNFDLYLIVSGDHNQMNKFSEMVCKHPKASSIKVFSKIPYEKLIYLYKNAKALLIPLRYTVQDEARFPHKIGEYTASAAPVITTKHGEIVHYFEDMKNALIAESYQSSHFAEKMEYIVKNPEMAEIIGANGKKVCTQYFDYKLYGCQIENFIFDGSKS